MRTITIGNHKGGVGKTTSSINIGAALALMGKRVLLIDLDPQSNLTQSLDIQSEESNIYKILKGEGKIDPVRITGGLYCIPSSLDLSGAEVELVGEPGREYILKDSLRGVNFDYVIIDPPPSLGLLTINALTASDEIIIPVQSQYLATQGLKKLLEVIDKVRKRLNKNLKFTGVFVTQYDGRKVLNRDVVSSLQEYLPGKVFSTIVRDNISLAEAPTKGLDIFRYSPESYGAEDYRNLSKEIDKGGPRTLIRRTISIEGPGSK